MEKILTIDGKEVKFKSTAATPLRYKSQFGKDFFSEIMKLEGLTNKKTSKKDMGAIDFEIFYEIAWVLAKTANNSLADPLTWLDNFETFPLEEILPELQDMIISTIAGKKK